MMTDFSILTVGYGYYLIDAVWNRVAERTGFQISHIPDPSLFPAIGSRRSRGSLASPMHYLFDTPAKALPDADCASLARLEDRDGPTINNIILGDAQLSSLPYHDALKYISAAAKRFEDIFSDVQPDLVLSGFDGFHSSLAMLVCRKMTIPWFGLVYTPIPCGLTGFTSTNNTTRTRSYGPMDYTFIAELAEKTLRDYESRYLAPFVPQTENSFKNILGFLPVRASNAASKASSILRGQFDRYTHRSFLRSSRDYLRRRWNLLANLTLDFATVPPSQPYVFFGFHMQPEMGIDIWSPFYSNQRYVIECIARAVPPTHKVLIKLHKIDADNWSTMQLRRLQRLPGLILVGPHADTRLMIEGADIVFSIQGTIALEAALARRHVITFGATMYEDMPSVTRVTELTELPKLVRETLKKPRVSKAEVRRGLEELLSRFSPGLYNNWQQTPTEDQISNFCNHLASLRDRIRSTAM